MLHNFKTTLMRPRSSGLLKASMYVILEIRKGEIAITNFTAIQYQVIIRWKTDYFKSLHIELM